MAKTIKHYEVFVYYINTEPKTYSQCFTNKPDYLSKDIPNETEKAFKFYTTDGELIIIMQSVIRGMRIKRVYET